MLGPTLRGERISLEPPRTEDLPIYCAWFADLEVTRYLLRPFPPSMKQEEEWYQRVATGQEHVVWSITAGGRTVGNCAIHGIDWINRNGETGLIIGERDAWGKGYASEAVRLRTTFAFGELGMERLGSESMAPNVAMHRALEKSGYRKIGQKRRVRYHNGDWLDSYIFELLRNEWVTHNG